METDELKERSGDVEVHGALDNGVALAKRELDEILLNVLRTAFAHSNVQRVGIYTGRQPGMDRITVVAEYDASAALPRVRSLGRPEEQCQVLTIEGLPSHCSVTWFDNRYDFVYQIAIQRTPR